MSRTATATATVAELLTNTRIDWRQIVALGGDVDAIRAEAIAHGDTVLARRAARHLAARA
jgi:hypothetical protein